MGKGRNYRQIQRLDGRSRKKASKTRRAGRAGAHPISVNLSKASADECILSRRDGRSHCQSQRYLSSKLSSCRFRNATVLFGNYAQERPQPFPRLRVQHRDALFGTENTMNIERAKGAGHGRIIFWHLELRFSRSLLIQAEIGSIVPLGRGYFPNDSRHFVPGYYQPVPPGQNPSGTKAVRP